jgi:hypothetical protein
MSILDSLFGHPDYMKQPAAWFHARILVGAGAMLTPSFCARNGVTHVINCAFDDDSPSWFRERNPNSYAVMCAHDTYRHRILDWYVLFEEAMHSFLRQGTGTVFVHCQAGMNRSAFLALTYVAKNFHIRLDDLVPSVKRQRPCMFSNQVYMNQVKEFINGRIQSAEGSGLVGSRDDERNSGLGTPGDHPDTQRLECDAGRVADRVE